jgi:hypothetical protein
LNVCEVGSIRRPSTKETSKLPDGVRVTTPLRTLVDVIAEGVIAPELQVQAVDQALQRGLIMRRQLETAPRQHSGATTDRQNSEAVT